MPNKEQNYVPARGFFFSVDFYDGSSKKFSSFKEVSGLSVKINTEDVAEGGENGFKYRLPTGAVYQNLVLKRPLNVDSELVIWCKDAIENFDFKLKTVTVKLLELDSNSTGSKPLAVWEFLNAYPVGWNLSNLDAMGNDLAVETIEIAFTRFARKK
ncbi:hypothetical protein BH09BAC1_BH09BAC1_21600 [soil metagenome]